MKKTQDSNPLVHTVTPDALLYECLRSIRGGKKCQERGGVYKRSLRNYGPHRYSGYRSNILFLIVDPPPILDPRHSQRLCGLKML